MNSNNNSNCKENGINYQSEIKNKDNNFLNSKRKSYISNNHKDLSAISINKSLNNTEIRLERVNNALINTRISDIKNFNPSCNQSHISVKSFLKANQPGYLNDYTNIIKILGGTICFCSISYFLLNNDYLRTCLNEVKDEIIFNKNEIIKGFAILASALFIFSLINYIKAEKEWKDICREISKETEEFIINYLLDDEAIIEEEYIIILISTKYNLDQTHVLKEVYNCYLMPLLSNNISLAKKTFVEEGRIKSFWVKS